MKAFQIEAAALVPARKRVRAIAVGSLGGKSLAEVITSRGNRNIGLFNPSSRVLTTRLL